MSVTGFQASNHPQQVARRGALDEVDDRRTTNETFEECRRLAGVEFFDLDPAATPESSRAVTYWTIGDDGLNQPWRGTVWCNPPYSDIRPWVERANAEIERNCSLIAMLLPANRTEQSWWQDLIEPGRRDGSIEVFFLRGRRRFDRPGWIKPAKGDRPPFGLCLVVWR